MLPSTWPSGYVASGPVRHAEREGEEADEKTEKYFRK